MQRFLFILFFLSCSCLSAQKTRVDSLIEKLSTARVDTVRQKLLTSIVFLLTKKDPDKAMKYSVQEMALAEQMNSKINIVDAWINRGLINYYLGKYPESIQCYKKRRNYLQVLN